MYERESGWSFDEDTSGVSSFPRKYVLEEDPRQGALRLILTEYDADSVALRKWKLSQILDGVVVEQEPYGRSIYQFDSTGVVISVRHESLEGTVRAVLPAPEVREAGIPAAGENKVFVFDAGGNLIGEREGEPGTLVYDPGFGAEGIIIAFADPVRDPLSVKPGTAVVLFSGGDLHDCLKKVGAYKRSHYGLFKGILYLQRESDYYGLLDFARNGEHPVHGGIFYISGTDREGLLAHNAVNFGNFLWGAAAQAAGVPLWIACLGAHINNMRHNHGHPDSDDDQLSIRAGYHFSQEHPRR